METMEIVLLIAGGIIFVLSFFIPDKKETSGGNGSTESGKGLAEEELKGLIGKEMDSIRTHVDDVVEEAVNYAMEKTERSLERLSNEKIMAVSEYSDTVLAEIHKNHEEAMFLYDMLNNKHINLKNTVSEVNRTVKEAEATVMNFQKLTPEARPVSEERVVNRAAEPPVQREAAELAREIAGMEKAGMKGTGLERIRTQKADVERTEPGSFGVRGIGTEKSGIQRAAGTEGSGIQRTAAVSARADNAAQRTDGIQNVETEKGLLQKSIAQKSIAQTIVAEKSGLERLGASTENAGLGKISFMQDVDEQGRNNNERILQLFQQGRSTVAIARELGLGVGEVKLVIDLFKNQ